VDCLIFAPGFSTAAQVTEISGRGVGMDVVKRNIEVMRGRVVISSVRGQGTTFKLVLPLTLAIIDGMLVSAGKERYIIPTLSIVESIQPDQKMLVTLAGRSEMINLRGEMLPLMRLDRVFALEGARQDPTQALVVIVEGVGRRFGVLVDEVVAQQQVVIKSMGAGLQHTPYVSGAAILSDGRVGLILNVEEISTHVHRGNRAVLQEAAWTRGNASAEQPSA
jgi:two-component system, chemotaxis family, sensor kinase CheA